MMDKSKTKKQLIGKLVKLSNRIAELQKLEDRFKRAKEALHKNEKSFRILFEEAPLPYQSLDKNGYILEVNKTWCEELGYSRKDVIGKWFGDFVSTSDRQDFRNTYRRFKAEGRVRNVVREIVKKNGSPIFILFDGRASYDEKGNFIKSHCIFKNITEQKQLEEMLEKERFRLSEYFENLPLLAYNIGLDGKIKDCNRAAAKTLGYKNKKQLIGNPLSTIYSPSSMKRAKELFSVWKKTGKLMNEELQIQTKQGKTLDVLLNVDTIYDKKGSPQYSLSTHLDITERKRAEDALRESEENLKKAQSLGNIGSWTWEIQGEKLFWSDQLFHIWGVEKDDFELSYDNVINLIHPDDREMNQHMVDLMLKKMKSGEYEFRIIQPSEEIRHIQQRFEVVRNTAGEPIRAIGTMQDITEVKRGQEEKTSLQQKLIQSEKMAGLGTLAGGVAHEFNNLLQIMRGHTEFALKTKKLEDLEEAARLVQDTSDKASKIIRDLLSFAKLDAPVTEVCDIVEAVEAVLSLTEAQLRKQNVNVVREYEETPKVTIDKTEVQQVFLNLVVNARDAMLPNGGKLKIKIQGIKGSVKVAFTDTGKGIEKTVMDRVFEPFFTTKRSAGKDSELSGTGLGLSVSYGIVKRHGGTIEVESEEGKGATFIVRLPAAGKETTEKSDEGEKMQRAKEPISHHILVVDDEEEICKMFQKWMSVEGHRVKTAVTGREGLELVGKEDFDVVFLDIVMPGIPSTQFLEALKEKSPKTEAVIITGKIMEKALWKELKQKGATQYIQKPFKFEDLEKVLRTVKS